MKNIITLSISMFLLVACGAGNKEELQTLKDEVMAIHDEVMPKMGELRKTRMALESQSDSLMAVDSTQAMVFKTLAADIVMANESMMQWMRGYEPEFEGTNREVAEYLEGQKKAIEQVKKDMNSTLAKGKEALAN